MRLFSALGLSGLFLTACTVHIGGTATDSAGGTEAASTGPTSVSSSSGEAPTTGDSQVTGEESSGSASTGEVPSSTGEVPSSTGGTSGGTDDSGLPGSSGGDTDGPVSGDATVDDSCAPDDGPALEFRLRVSAPMCGAMWSGDVLRVVLYQGGPLAPGNYMLDGGKGFAWLEQGDQPPVSSETGTIVIDAWEGEMVSGSYMLPGLGADVLAGSFAGPHCPAGGLCG